jgi:hypothetical protein
MRKPPWILFVVGCLFGAFVLVGCGDDDDASDSISKEEFVSSANAICEEGAAEIEAAEGEGLSEADFFLTIVIPSIRQQSEDMRALGFPEGDADTVEEILDDTEAALVVIETDPESIGGANPFATVNRQLGEYGLTVCAEG